MTTSRLERLLPWACVAAAAVLFASEFMTMFEFTPPGAEPLEEQTGGARHGNAMFVISAFAALATIAAVWFGSRPAAIGVAVMGGIALLFFLVGDLPKAGQIGTLDDESFRDAEVIPQAGFWLMMLSSVALTLSGCALATMSSEQLSSLRGNFFRRGASKQKPPAPAAK